MTQTKIIVKIYSGDEKNGTRARVIKLVSEPLDDVEDDAELLSKLPDALKGIFLDATPRMVKKFALSTSGEWIEVPEGTVYPQECWLPTSVQMGWEFVRNGETEPAWEFATP
jgi:hypothetical protein